MKQTLALVLMVFGSFGAFAADDMLTREFVPLESFGMLKGAKYQADSISDRNFEYVAFRCLALTTAINHKALEPETKKEKDLVLFFAEAKTIAIEFAYFAFNSVNKIDQDAYKDSNPFFDKVKEVLLPLGQSYLKLFSINQETKDSYFGSDFLEGDIDVCGSSIIMKKDIPGWRDMPKWPK